MKPAHAALFVTILTTSACSPRGDVIIQPVFSARQALSEPVVVPASVTELRVTVSGDDMSDIVVRQTVDGPGVLRVERIPAGSVTRRCAPQSRCRQSGRGNGRLQRDHRLPFAQRPIDFRMNKNLAHSTLSTAGSQSAAEPP